MAEQEAVGREEQTTEAALKKIKKNNGNPVADFGLGFQYLVKDEKQAFRVR